MSSSSSAFFRPYFLHRLNESQAAVCNEEGDYCGAGQARSANRFAIASLKKSFRSSDRKMAAYGAVVSLLHNVKTVIDRPDDGTPVSLHKLQLQSLHQKVSFLLDFLENSTSLRTTNRSAQESLETRIRAVAYVAEDFVESKIMVKVYPAEARSHIRDSANVGDDPITESQTSNGNVWDEYPLLPASHLAHLLIYMLIARLFDAAVQKLMVVMIQLILPVMNVRPFTTIRTLIPVTFQNLIFVLAQVMIPLTVQILWPLCMLNFVSVVITELMRMALFKGVSLAAPFVKPGEILVRTWFSLDDGTRQVSSSDEADDSEHERGELLLIMEEIDLITKHVIKIKDVSGADDWRTTRNLSSARSSSRGDLSVGGEKNVVVVGFESDLEEMKTRLVDSSLELKIISIVGMGGIGKTTLARQVYGDSYIDYHFDTRGWVTVSQEYSLRQVLIVLLDSAKILTEKMYDKKEKIWLTVSIKASWEEDVALYADSFSPLHKMQFLKEGESWNLLCKKVFGEKDCPPELEDIGKAIARNCGGLPLAIVVIGGLLSKESRRQEYWRNLAENLSSVVTKEDDKQCLEILGLSYNRLPQRLRACFLYMAVFPEDYEIPVAKLIRLWAAEGFLKPNASKTLEDLAEEYLDDLIERNLILVSKRSANGKIRTCNIHDLLRNLCLQNAQKENFLYVVKYDNDVLQQGVNISPRRLSVHPDFLSIQSQILYESEIHNSSAHSLLCTGARLIYPSGVYLGYKLLRVLDLIIVRFFHFPAEITKLVYLRYLAFTYNEALPPSIAELLNLQTLVYHNWTFGECPVFPVEIWMMPKLRHLCVTPCRLPVPPNVQMVVLGNLHTLSEARNLRCSDDILKRIPNLKELGISYDVSSMVGLSEYQLEALVNLHQLETLKLSFKYSSHHASEIVNLPNLAFPEKLKRLTLAGCGIPWSSMTIVGALPHLEVLKLRKHACQGIEWEPVEEQFRQLKHLLLEEVDLVRWAANETHFPRLQRLIIRSCYRLKEIPSDLGEIQTLEIIELVDCHHSAVTSAEQIQEEQEGMGNEQLKVCIDLRRYFKNKFYSKIFH
ncbi:UNVERIFIED_CONTAM: putative late blight resistance proteinR1B-16 [Sesamum calycinum]|uniref:Late blight resistance proteinR1B-16 n=1 Tax=Sesamum calycinum TaxID=2727403 RepID=A0AAW2NIM5_9LAMI